MIAKLLIALFISLSFRSANQPNVKHDYEVGLGWKGQYHNFEIERERENGIKYKAHQLTLLPSKYLTGDWLVKEARDIDSESLSLNYPIGVLKISLVESWQEWKDPRTLVGLSFKTDGLDIDYQTNFSDRKIFRFRLGHKFKTRRKYYLEPLIIYNNISGKKFWQMKVILGWQR